ncbi:MAG: hypothetical protein IPJ79_05170 [Bacteroidetes bacterium]|nr:hypothetical protein [Bacteroidota bacterium]
MESGSFPSFSGWAIIIDDLGNIIDFVALNWDATTIASTNLTIGPFTVSPGTKWTGAGINQTTVTAGNSVSRIGTSDNNDLSDFNIQASSIGTINSGMSIPFTGFGCESVPYTCTSYRNSIAYSKHSCRISYNLYGSECNINSHQYKPWLHIYVDTRRQWCKHYRITIIHYHI